MRIGNCAQQPGECEINREFENKHRTDLYEQSSIYFGRFGAKQMCAKSCCEIRANSMHAFVIKRNWWQQPKSFEQKKGKIESGSIAVAAAAVDKNAVKFSLSHSLLPSSFSLLKNPNQLPKIEARLEHTTFSI